MPRPVTSDPANAAYSRAFDVLSRKLKGKARVRALGRFDVQLMKNLAPLAVLSVTNNLTFFSDRVDPASLQYSPVVRLEPHGAPAEVGAQAPLAGLPSAPT